MIVFKKSYPVATIIVGIDKKNENSSAAGRDRPATCPAAMVDIEREVPGKQQKEFALHRSISPAAGSFLPCASCVAVGRRHQRSTSRFRRVAGRRPSPRDF